MKDAKIFSKSVNFLSEGDLGRKIVELGWETSVDNYESWVDDWNNYDNDWENWVGNGLTLSGHGCFSSMRNSGDSSSQDCTFEHRDFVTGP